MTEKSGEILEQEKYARKVCFVIGVLGILVFTLFNWNFQLMFSGGKYETRVLQIDKGINECYKIKVEFNRAQEGLIQKEITDCTGETFLFLIEEGDTLTLWESKDKPYKHYVPFINFGVKLFLIVFFIFIPMLFALFGRY